LFEQHKTIAIAAKVKFYRNIMLSSASGVYNVFDFALVHN